jgi:hypothetical protein
VKKSKPNHRTVRMEQVAVDALTEYIATFGREAPSRQAVVTNAVLEYVEKKKGKQ